MEKHITLFTEYSARRAGDECASVFMQEKIFSEMERQSWNIPSSMNKIGLVLYGRAILYCCDEEGNEYMIDELEERCCFWRTVSSPGRLSALLCDRRRRNKGNVH